MANQKRIPFIPQQTPDFKPMRYYYCETDVSAKSVTRSVFLRLLAEGHPFFSLKLTYQGDTLLSAVLDGRTLPLL